MKIVARHCTCASGCSRCDGTAFLDGYVLLETLAAGTRFTDVFGVAYTVVRRGTPGSVVVRRADGEETLKAERSAALVASGAP